MLQELIIFVLLFKVRFSCVIKEWLSVPFIFSNAKKWHKSDSIFWNQLLRLKQNNEKQKSDYQKSGMSRLSYINGKSVTQ